MSQCTYYPNEVVQHAVCVFAAFYVDCQPPDFCFVPCGHMASEKTVKYWADVPIPCGTSGFQVSAHLNNFIWLSRGSGQWVCIYDVRIFVQYVIYEAPSHLPLSPQSACPFCAVPLTGTPGYVKLIFACD